MSERTINLTINPLCNERTLKERGLLFILENVQNGRVMCGDSISSLEAIFKSAQVEAYSYSRFAEHYPGLKEASWSEKRHLFEEAYRDIAVDLAEHPGKYGMSDVRLFSDDGSPFTGNYTAINSIMVHEGKVLFLLSDIEPVSYRDHKYSLKSLELYSLASDKKILESTAEIIQAAFRRWPQL